MNKEQKAMDDLFRFKIGDTIQHAALGDFIEEPTGTHASRPKGDEWSFGLSFRETVRYYIEERYIIECHGGIQKFYKARAICPDGRIDTSPASNIPEFSAVKAAPFKNIAGKTRKEIIEWLDKERPTDDRKT